MEIQEKNVVKRARNLGYRGSEKGLLGIVSWLREKKQIHVEVGSIWDDLHNNVEGYCYTLHAPINIYFTAPVYASGGMTYDEMLIKGISEALLLLQAYNEQKNLSIPDDVLVVAYLKGYGDKEIRTSKPHFRSNMEKYAYFLGREGDYIEEGLTEDDILLLVKNIAPNDEVLQLS